MVSAVLLFTAFGSNAQNYFNTTTNIVNVFNVSPPSDGDQRDIFWDLGNLSLDYQNNFKPDLLSVVNYKRYNPPYEVYYVYQSSWYENSGDVNFGNGTEIFYIMSQNQIYDGVGATFAKVRSNITQHPKLKDFVILSKDKMKLYLVDDNSSITEGQVFNNFINAYYVTSGEFYWYSNREDIYVYQKENIGGTDEYYIKVFKAESDIYPYINQNADYSIEIPYLGENPKIVVKRINEKDGPFRFGESNWGKPDLIVKGENFISIYQNDDNNHLNLIKTITPGFEIFDAAIEDLNNDGYNDLIFSKKYSNSDVRIYINTKGGVFFNDLPDYTISNGLINIYPVISAADLNVDGFNDLIISAGENTTTYMNLKTGFSNTPDQNLPGFEYPKQIKTADLNGTGGISIILKGSGGIWEYSFPPIVYQGLARYNPESEYMDPKPAPPVIERGVWFDGTNYHPLIKFSNRGELDFSEYKFYKWKPGYNEFQVFHTTNQGNSFVDMSEIVYEDCSLPPSYYGSLIYKITSVDKSSKESDFSDEIKYTILQSENDNIIIKESKQPTEYSISQNYPNPFNSVTNIQFDLPKEGLVTLKVYDVLGREVKSIVNEFKQAGSYIVSFDGSELSSGIYFYRLEAGDFVQVKRMILLK